MLYVIQRGNNSDLPYRGGQGDIVHLEADLRAVVCWADQNNRKWCFSSANAAAGYVEFYSDLEKLSELNWSAIAATVWEKQEIHEGKQAEFLIHHSLPFELIRRIGVHSPAIRQKILTALGKAGYRPDIEVQPSWYY